MSLELRKLVDVVTRTRDPEIRGVELLAEEASGHALSVRRGRLLRTDPSVRQRVVGRVWLDGGRCGADEGGSLADVEDILQRAAERAALAPEDPLAGPVEDVRVRTRGLGTDDRRYAMLEHADHADVLLGAERAARAVDRRITTGEFRYRDEREHRVYVSTRGVALEEHTTTFAASGVVFAEEEHESLRLEAAVEGRSFSSIASLPFGAMVARRLVNLLRPGPALSGPTRVLFPPHVSAALFARIAEVFGWKDPRESFLGKAPAGEPVAHRKLHLVDDGGMVGALRTHAFDDRGAPPVALTLLREGVLDARYLDVEQARRADLSPTGHHFGGRLRPSNLALRQGTRSMSALLSEHSEVDTLMVEHMEDPGALDLFTGQLSTRVSGVMRRGHDDLGAVRGVVIEGNLTDILPQLVDIASDTDRIGHVDAPGMFFDGFVVQ
jgi:predicted Zn-dependent protease